MRCDNCGAEFDDQEKFCPQCWTPRHHQLPSMNKVQSAGPAREERFQEPYEDGKPVPSNLKRNLLLALLILASLGLIVLLTLEVFQRWSG